MKIYGLIAACFLLTASSFRLSAQQHPDSLWFRYDNRFTANRSWVISGYDTITFSPYLMNLYKPGDSLVKVIMYPSNGEFRFANPGRYLYRPSSMNCDFTKESSQWCFARSQESDHFVVFWEEGVDFDKDYILERAERAWDVYVNRLKFITPGKSKGTDKYKIVMRMYNSSSWIASGSGEDNAVGTLNLSPSAYMARGGHTVAHEVGHTFQFLTGVDNAANGTGGFGWGFADNGSGDNCFWEDCANWQAYKVYPERQFTDGEYFELYMNTCHLNLLHENLRYNNCYYQDYLTQVYGDDFIARIWRECKSPEDPVDVICRIQRLTQADFSALMYDCFVHMCTWDIDGVRSYAKHRIGSHPNRLEKKDIDGETWYQPSVDYCPQNYGYNITQLRVPTADTEIKIAFRGLVGESGYKTVYESRAGWRWGVVTYLSDGTTQYGEMQTSANDTLSYSVPAGASKMWLVVMGAPTVWWHHEWDRNGTAPATNDEQWPYRVHFEGTDVKNGFSEYTAADFPADYHRHDTTLVVDAYLSYDASSYTSTYVQYDMDAISQALGLTTDQLKSIQVGSSYNPRFVGISKNGTVSNATTTSTSSSTVFGHWFTTLGFISEYNSSAAIFAEMTPADYKCKVGQYPGKLKAGNEYVVRQAVYYKVGSRTYKATIEVHLHVL